MEMAERSRVLVLDLLESFARERDVNVRIERRKEDRAWVCTVTNGGASRGSDQRRERARGHQSGTARSRRRDPELRPR